jgi:hypothetical protein
MSTGQHPGPDSNRQGDDFFRSKQMYRHTGTDNIGNRIVSADLMKMNMVRSVDCLLCLCDPDKNVFSLCNYCRRSMCLSDDIQHFLESPVGRTGTGMDLHGSNATPVYYLTIWSLHNRTHRSHDLLFVSTKAQESSTYHIPCSAVKGVKCEKTHGSYTFKSRRI